MSAHIQINRPQECFDLKRRVARSSGILIRTHQVLGVIGIPKDDWECLDDREWSNLLSRSAALSRDSVTAIDLRGGAFQELSSTHQALLEAFRCEPPFDAHHPVRDLIDQAITCALVSVERVMGKRLKAFLHARLAINAPFLESTGYNVQTRSFMGLHYDRYKSYEPEDDACFQLIGLNLGLCERSFCFSRFSPSAVGRRRKLHGQQGHALDDSASGIGSFLPFHENEPIYRMTLEPLQAYIAPTQCIIHDGMTNRKGLADVSLFIACQFHDG